jgi:hypothetical protein
MSVCVCVCVCVCAYYTCSTSATLSPACNYFFFPVTIFFFLQALKAAESFRVRCERVGGVVEDKLCSDGKKKDAQNPDTKVKKRPLEEEVLP